MSLRDKAMLVSISVTKPMMQKKDKQTTTEVALDKNASTAAVAVINKLYPKHLIAPIQEVESAARRYVESVTQPWARGTALLPSALFMTFQQDIGVFKLQFEQAVTVFLNNYAGVMAAAEHEQGSMFSLGNYPDLSEIKRDFTFSVRYMPLGDVPSVYDGIEASMIEDLKADVEAQTKQDLAAGQKSLYVRLAAAIERIKVQCGNPKGKIYDTLTGNLSELLTVLPALNLGNDEAFTALCAEAKELVVSPEAIKTVPEIRESMAKKAEEIMKSMEAYL